MSRGLWIMLSVDLLRHPKIFRLSRQLNINRRDAIYYMINLWISCIVSRPDGYFPANPDEIAYAADLDTDNIKPDDFLHALLTCGDKQPGFLERSPDGAGYHVHDWEQFSGKININKASGRDRTRRFRLRQKVAAGEIDESEINDYITAARVRDSKKSASQDGQQQLFDPLDTADAADPKSPSARLLAAEFEALWQSYPRKVGSGKKKACECYIQHRRRGVPKDEFEQGLAGYQAYLKRNGIAPKYVMMGSTFFGGGERWKEFLITETDAVQTGGMSEPRTNDDFAKEENIINTNFGGDIRTYVQWVTAGSPQPVQKWYDEHRKHTADGHR